MSTKTAMELAADIKRLSDQVANAETAEVTTGIWAGDSDRARAELYASIDALLSLAQASQARTDGGAVAWQYEFVDRPGHWFPVHRLDDLERLKTYPMLNLRALGVLATPPGNATQAAGAQWISVKDRLPDEDQDVWYFFDLVGVHCGRYFGGGAFGGKAGFLGGCEVTHWMPCERPASPAAELKKD